MLAIGVGAFVLGLAVAATPGPIGALCVARTLAHGARSGLATGLGAALADALFAFAGALGLAQVLRLGGEALPLLAAAGGLLLLALGWRAWRAPPAGDVAAVSRGPWWDLVGVVALTLTNPVTIATFALAFAALGAPVAPSGTAAALFAASVFLGSAVWWLALVAGVSQLGARVGPPARARAGRVAAAVVASLGLLAFVGALRAWV